MLIEVKVVRSGKWVAEQRLKRGENVPKEIKVPVEVSDLSEDARRILLEYGNGKYCDFSCLGYLRDFSPAKVGMTAYGRERFLIDSESPAVHEIDSAIIAAAERIKLAKEQAEFEAQQKKEAEQALAAEWASLPLAERASADGIKYCVPINAGKDYSGPLCPSGGQKYDPRILQEYEPNAWAEALAESNRLSKIRNLERKAERLDADVDTLSQFLAVFTEDELDAGVTRFAESHHMTEDEVKEAIESASTEDLFNREE